MPWLAPTEREMPSLLSEISSPGQAYEAARMLSRRVVEAATPIYGTKGAAIDRVSRHYKLGTFLKKVFHGERASVHLHHYAALCNALEELVEQQRRRAESNEQLLKRLRGEDAVHHVHRSVVGVDE